jgi:hypothetical protein
MMDGLLVEGVPVISGTQARIIPLWDLEMEGVPKKEVVDEVAQL